MLKRWQIDKNKFKVSNGFALRGDLNALKWTYSFDFTTGRTNFNKNVKDEELSRTDYKVLHDQIAETKVHNISEFITEFIMDQEKVSKDDKWFFENKIDIEGGDVYRRGDLLIFPLRSKAGEKVEGLYFLNTLKDIGYTFGFERLGLFLEGNSSLNYFCYNIKDGYNARNLTGGRVGVFFKDYDMVQTLKKITRDMTKEYIVLGTNPTADDLVKKKLTPEEYYKMERGKFNFAINVIVKFPPNFSNENSPQTFYDYYKKDPERCSKIIKEKSDNPELTILGSDQDSVWLWSRNKDRPVCIRSNTKLPELLLLAPKKFWQEKYGTIQEKNIVSNLFASASGIQFKGENIRQAGIYNDGGNMVINTGEKIVGKPSEKYFYLKVGHFPEPKKDAEINSKDFFNLMNNVFSNTSINEKSEGYSIIAWSILSLFAPALPSQIFSSSLWG